MSESELPSRRTLLPRLKRWFESKKQTQAVPVEPLNDAPHAESVNATEIASMQSAATVEPQPAHAQKSPVSAPKAMRRKRAAFTKKMETAQEEKKPAAHMPHLLNAFPLDRELIGASPMEIVVDGRTHVLAFRNESIILDGRNYSVIKENVALDLISAKHTALGLTLVIGAFGKTGSLILENAQLGEMMSAMLRTGTYKDAAEDLVITRF